MQQQQQQPHPGMNTTAPSTQKTGAQNTAQAQSQKPSAGTQQTAAGGNATANTAAGNTGAQTGQITKGMKDRAESAKAYIEGKYQKLKKDESNRKQAWDILQHKMQKLNLSGAEQELIKQDILHKEAELNRKMRKKISTRDFEPLSIIGRGAFGEVRICRHIETGEVVAVKRMKKGEMIQKNQVNHIKAEREVLVKAKNQWIVELKFSFQDEKYLYLVMDFLPGGDLMTLLMRKDILSEEESRFYISQTILSIQSVHKVNYIHRDLKPDNILIDKDGHVKLTDFGLCKHAEIRPSRMTEINTKELSFNFNQLKSALDKKLGYKRTRQLAFSTVGTPDYIAPEVFGQYGYDETVDWWSVGCILFEMLVGYPPFFSDEPSITCQKIMHWKKTFSIPPEAKLSPASIDILKKLICDADTRLGRNGSEEIMAHAFFDGVEWDKLRNLTPPYIPTIQSEISNENFDQFDEEDPFHRSAEAKRKTGNRKVDMNFVGYTYKADVEAEKSMLVNVLKELDSVSDQTFEPNEIHQNDSQEQSENIINPNINSDSKNYGQQMKEQKPGVGGSTRPLHSSTNNYQAQQNQQVNTSYQNTGGMGNRQPVKQFKPSPRVGMVQGAGGQIVRPGTAGGATNNMARGGESHQNTINFKQPGPSSTKGFQGGNQMVYQQQMNKQGFSNQNDHNIQQTNASSHYLRGPGGTGNQQNQAPQIKKGLGK